MAVAEHDVRVCDHERKVPRNLYMIGQQKAGKVAAILTDARDFSGKFPIAGP